MYRYFLRVARFSSDEEGATAVEYAVMLALIVMACISAVIALGNSTSASFTDSQTKITSAMGGS